MPLGQVNRAAQRAHQETTQHFKILHPLAQPDANTTVAEILQELDNLTTAAIASPKLLELHLWETWWALLEIVARTPPTQQYKLVDFMTQLQKKTLIDPTSGEQLKSSDLNMWTQLPTFSWAVKDGWNTNVYDPNLTADDIQRWDNRNAFLAQLTAAAEVDYSIAEHHPMDFSLFGLQAFGVAFEGYAPAGASLDTAVRAACWWFIYAADRLWTNVENGREWEGEIGSGLGDYKTKGWTGYNRDRWGVWENYLLNASNDVLLGATVFSEDTQKLIKDALTQTKRITLQELDKVGS